MSEKTEAQKNQFLDSHGIDTDYSKHRPEESIKKKSSGFGNMSGKVKLTIAIAIVLIIAVASTYLYQVTHPVYDITIMKSGEYVQNVEDWDLTPGEYKINFSAVVRGLEAKDTVELQWFDESGSVICTETTEVFFGNRENYGRIQMIHSNCTTTWSEGSYEIAVNVEGETIQTAKFKIKD